ncbi:MAG: V-type ATP synthase subunit I [Nitrososphaerales archaeon]
MLLKPASMQRIAVVGLKEERQKLVAILYDLGVVQIEQLSKEAALYLRAELDNVNSREVSEELLRIRTLKTALPPLPVMERMGFASTRKILEAARSLKIDDQVSKLKQSQSRLGTKLDDLNNNIDLVTKLSFVNEDLSMFDLDSAASFFGTCSAETYEEFRKSLSSIENEMTYTSGKDPASVIVVVPNQELEKFGSVIQKANMRLQRIPKFKGTPSEVLAGLNEEKSSAQSELKKVESELQSLSAKYYGLISSIDEQLSIEARKLEVLNNFGFTDSSFVLEGWVPSEKLKTLEDSINRFTRSSEIYKIKSTEKPPTLLQNPKQVRFFESFIRFYSLPVQGEFDPTLIFALTFPIFFGLMLGDVGYGIVILGIAFWILKRVAHPGGKTIIPGKLRSFAKRIFKPTQFRKIAMAMIPGSIIGIIMGFVFNNYFGFQLNQYLFSYLNSTLNLNLPASGAFLDPISPVGLKELLLFAGYVGIFEVSFGLVLGMITSYWLGHRKHIFAKLGWLFTAWGISLIGLTVLHHQNVSPAANPIAGLYMGVLITGIGLIAYGEGGQALIELPSIVSHILSYTRLVGILLASVILAHVIDLIFLGNITGGVFLAVGAVVILVMGQLFNIILASFEPGIQGARLIYVELFSKFFHGSGKPFLPFKGGRVYTVREIEMMESDEEKKVPNVIAR